MSLNGKVAIVTGATGALGRVVAKTLLDRGARVVATHRGEEKLKELSDFVGNSKDMLVSVQTDVTDENSVQTLFQRVISQYGHVDILLNIVGAFKGGAEIVNTSVSDWDFLLNVNLKSAFLCSKAALSHMIRQNYGKIINVSSRTAAEKRYRVKDGAYAVSKAGIIVLTETVAEEVKKYDINVNCILPSTIDTPDNRRNFPNADFAKWVKPEQVAEVMLFLVSDESKTISGASIPVYGKA
ncbi:MAG TPA: SDR family NAD(P)-dependent oxidoreductase [candidate division Zixibacteria bacterium]|nr:SDR family NAD(P)-dependent oxidoreductase [candidate division Zixibacteria bacterium]